MVEIMVEQRRIIMSDKNQKVNEIYIHILSWGLSYLRNYLERPWYKRINNKSHLFVANLLHYIPSRMFDDEDFKKDIEFIEIGATYFINNFKNHSDYIFPIISDLILELYELLSNSNLEIKWKFPEEVKQIVIAFRKENQSGT